MMDIAEPGKLFLLGFVSFFIELLHLELVQNQATCKLFHFMLS